MRRATRAALLALLAAALVRPAAAQETEPSTELVTPDVTAAVDRSSISGDGRFVLFAIESDAERESGAANAYIRDRRRQTTEQIRISAASDAHLTWSDLSSDGRWIALSGWDQTTQRSSLWLYERVSRRASLVAPGSNAQLSPDARWLLFLSDAALDPADNDSGPDLYVHDRRTGRFEMVPASLDGAHQSRWTLPRDISADGRYVLFESCASSVIEEDTNGECDVFRHDRRIHVTRRVSVSSDGRQATGASWHSSMSHDGRFVAFLSYATNLVVSDTNGDTDVFVHDTISGDTVRVSVGGFGVQADSGSDAPALSGNGRVIVFTSGARNLVPFMPFATVFVHDRVTGITRQADLDENGRRPEGAGWNPAITTDGRFVSFATWASLTANDGDSERDVYVRDFGTRTPVGRLHAALEDVRGVVMAEDTRSVLEAALTRGLLAAQRGDRFEACSTLLAFAYDVQVQWNRALTSSDAARLFSAADTTRRDLGCPAAEPHEFRFFRSRFPLSQFPWFGLAAGDFNADGNIDTAVTHTESLSILPGDRYGSFANSVPVAAGRFPRGLVAHDLNDDGADDLVVANQEGASASVFIGTPGQFAFTRTELPAGQNPVAVAAGDFTGDQVPDIVIANASESFLTLYRGTPDGAFIHMDHLPIGYTSNSVAVADIDGDGCGDILVAGWGAMSLAVGVKDGAPQLSAHLAFGSYRELEIADFNADGRPDIAFVVGDTGSVGLLMNNGSGAFEERGVIDAPSPFFMDSGDLNGDGRTDLIVSSYTPSGLWVLTGNGDGTFGIREWFDRDIGASEVTVIDLNHDGANDVILLASTARTAAESGWPSVNVLLNRPLVSVTTPNTRETWAIGGDRNITWQHRLPRGTTFRIDVSRDNGATWRHLQTLRVAGSPAKFVWHVTGPATTAARFRVSAEGQRSATDINDALITLSDPFVRLNAPRAEIGWGIGSTQLIQWSHNLGANVPMTVELSRDNGAHWSIIGSTHTRGTESSTWKWTVMGPAAPQAIVRVKAANGPAAGLLTGIVIQPAYLQLLPLVPATPWNACESRNVRWKSNLGRGEAVRVDVSTDGGMTWQVMGMSNTGKLMYAPPEHVRDVTVRVRWPRDETVQSSSSPFTVLTTPVPNWCDDGQ